MSIKSILETKFKDVQKNYVFTLLKKYKMLPLSAERGIIYAQVDVLWEYLLASNKRNDNYKKFLVAFSGIKVSSKHIEDMQEEYVALIESLKKVTL